MPAGSLICVWVNCASLVSVSTVTDSLGNTYTQAGSNVDYAGRLSLWYAENAAAGAPTVTVTLASAAHFLILVSSYTGVATSSSLNDTSSSTGTSTAPTTTSVTVATAGDLVIAHLAIIEPIAPPAPSSPFDFLGWLFAYINPARSPDYVATGYIYDDTAAPASEACSWTLPSSVAWGALGASFKAAAAASPPTPPPPIYLQNTPGPPLLGMPWTTQLSLRPAMMAAPPPPPAPPTPPVPVPPPPPPGVPPPPPPLPPPPSTGTASASPLSLPREPDIDPRTRRHLEQSADIWNSLFRTGQIIQLRHAVTGDIDYMLIAALAGGLTGYYGTSTGVGVIP